MRLAVVGHVEWVQFARVESVPSPGDIVHALDAWEEPAGGGAVAAAQLAGLGGGAAFFTALGDDYLGHQAAERLTAAGLEMHVAWRTCPQRRAFTFLDAEGERTITVLGERLIPHAEDPLPWGELEEADGVYFTGGDPGALLAARRARVLVATPRARETLDTAGVKLDALVLSASDEGERTRSTDLRPAPSVVVYTDGERGGRWTAGEGREGVYEAAPLPGPVVDAYGAGDSFAAGLTYGLAAGEDLDAALALAARCGAHCLTGRGPFEAQLRL